MIWLQPVALLGLLAIAGPILVHLLRRQQAQRVVVPTTRFVRAVTDSAIRFRRLSDLLLLLVRVSIVALAAIALAAPLWLSSGRIEDWNRRTVRALVVDRSASARDAITAELVAAESAESYASRVIETTDLRDGLVRASAWLRDAPPGRREVVVLSDFQHGSLTQSDLSVVGDGVGLRFVPVTPQSQPAPPAHDVLSDGAKRQLDTLVADGRTGARFGSATGPDWSGIEIEGATAAQAAFLRRVVARAGSWAPDTAMPIVIRFGSPSTTSGAIQLAPEQVRRMQRLLRSEALAGVSHRAGLKDGKPFLEVDVDPSSVAAAEVVLAALEAIPNPALQPEWDPVRTPPAVLSAWSREPAPVDASAARHADRTDGRWLWGGVLLLLGVEWWLRRSRVAPAEKVHAHAA